MLYIKILGCLLILLCSAFGKAQEKENLYFMLQEGHYDKGVQEMVATIKTKRKVKIYTFSIPCKCINGGSLFFYNHNNPETGVVFEPIQIIRNERLKKLNLINFEQLVSLMRKNDDGFNKKYALYFIEANSRNVAYHVYKGSMFADNYVDIIYLDSTGKIMDQIY